ncbi:MAG: hypothetical protein RLZZ234_366 [Candidatus Parcubacteria bacterium]
MTSFSIHITRALCSVLIFSFCILATPVHATEHTELSFITKQVTLLEKFFARLLNTDGEVRGATMSTQISPIKNLKILNWNIGFTRAAVYGGPDKLPEIVASIKKVNADVVLLQEVDYMAGRSGNKDLIEVLRTQTGYPYAHYVRYTAVTKSLGGGEVGTLILTKYRPLLREEWPLYYERKQAGNGTWEIPRSLNSVTVGIPTGTSSAVSSYLPITFANIHLQFQDPLVQGLQARDIVSWAKQNASEIIFIGGDFNAHYNVALKKESVGYTTYKTLLDGGFTFFADDAAPKSSAIDHISMKASAAHMPTLISYTHATLPGSDHAPVIAEFAIPTSVLTPATTRQVTTTCKSANGSGCEIKNQCAANEHIGDIIVRCRQAGQNFAPAVWGGISLAGTTSTTPLCSIDTTNYSTARLGSKKYSAMTAVQTRQRDGLSAGVVTCSGTCGISATYLCVQ